MSTKYWADSGYPMDIADADSEALAVWFDGREEVTEQELRETRSEAGAAGDDEGVAILTRVLGY